MFPQKQKPKNRWASESDEVRAAKIRRRPDYIGWGLRLMIMVVIASGLGYIYTMNDLAVQGFVLNEQRERVALLSSENERIEQAVMAYTAHQRVNERARAMAMVKVDAIDYIAITPAGVAMR